MALTVNTNVSALNAQRHTMDSQAEMAQAMERLASGKRINGAVDDAAGLAITARMESQISGLAQAVRNAGDAISLVETAEGALHETTAILQRIRELAIQSAGGAPSNADRVNLHKEVEQLQEELARIANTTRFNGEILLNGTFHDKDFQIGQTNNEEISVSIGDLRPERIGAYSQHTVDNVGHVNIGSDIDDLTNGVNQQTLIVQVGNEIPRTIFVNEGNDARTISDKLNQAGAQINSRAVTSVDVYIDGTGSFSFDLSSSSTPDIIDNVLVGATAGSQARTMAAEINAGYSEHNISAEVIEDENGVEFVRMYQDQGYDLKINDFVTTGTNTLDFTGDGESLLTGAFGSTAAIVGGSLIIDAPDTFLLSSDDASNTILVGTRASLEVVGASHEPSDYQDLSFNVNVNGRTETIRLLPAEPTVITEASEASTTLEFSGTTRVREASSGQIGAVRPQTHTIAAGAIVLSDADGDGIDDTNTPTDHELRFAFKAGTGGAWVDIDLGLTLGLMGYEDGDEITGAVMVSAIQSAFEDSYFDDVTVSLTDNGQIQFSSSNDDVLAIREHSTIRAAGRDEFMAVFARAAGGTPAAPGDGSAEESTTTGTLILGSATDELGTGPVNAAGADGPVNPFGVANFTWDTDSDGDGALEFSISLNGQNATTITIAAETAAASGGSVTYYSVAEMADAVQDAIDNSSPFGPASGCHVQVEATRDGNGDWGLTFSSAEGASIDVGGDIIGANMLNITTRSTTPDVGAFDEQVLTLTGADTTDGAEVSNSFTQFALRVNSSQESDFIDIDLIEYLYDAGVAGGASPTVDEDTFIEALQAAINDVAYFADENAVTVSVNQTTGLVEMSVAGGVGSIAIREHSSYYSSTGAGTNGLVNLLTGGDTVLSQGTGTASESTDTGTLTLGSAANDNTAGSVKPFGISAITLDSSNNTFTLVVNNPDGSTSGSTSFTVAEGTYSNMTDLVAAMNTALDGSICATSEPWEVVFSAQEDTGVDPIAWGVNISSPSGYEVVFSGTLYTEDDALDSAAGIATGATKTITALTQPTPGDAAYTSSVEAGAFVGGVDLLVDETDADDADRLQITASVTDGSTGDVIDLSFTLDSGTDSVAVSDYLGSVVTGLNAASTAGGYQFVTAVVANDDGTYGLSMSPAGPYTLSVAGVTVTESFGGPISAVGQASNIDGLAFESMDDVVSQMNAAFLSAGLGLSAAFNRGGDTWNFAVTSGPSDASSTLAFSGDSLADVGFTGTLDSIGGGTASTETVRYVSQIDISTRDSALLAMTVVDAALETIAADRAGLGAVANRLEATISNLMTISENTSASMSRVMDADFAAESTRLARAQILQETSVAMLAQANAAAQTVLKLLQ